MAQVLVTQEETAKYSENLFKKFTAFNSIYSGWNIMAGVGAVDNSLIEKYKGNYSLRAITNQVDEPLVFNSANNGFEIIAPKTGTYIFSVKIFVPTTYSNNEVFGIFDTFINGSGMGEFQFQWSNQASNFVHGKWNNFFQYVQLSQGDVYDISFKFFANQIGARAFLDGFKMEFDDRGLGIPSRYTFPLDTIIENTAVVNIPIIDANDTDFVDVNFAGAVVGDFIQMVLPPQMATSELIVGQPLVSATNTIRLSFHNHKGSASVAISNTVFKFKIVR